jgi:hypothetical protein
MKAKTGKKAQREKTATDKPFTWSDFERLVDKAARTPALKHVPKSK